MTSAQARGPKGGALALLLRMSRCRWCESVEAGTFSVSSAAQPEASSVGLLLLSRHCVGMGGLFSLQPALSGCRGFLRKPW
jgi:hypothetical protein